MICNSYCPDIQAQGDCRNCGHTYAAHVRPDKTVSLPFNKSHMTAHDLTNCAETVEMITRRVQQVQRQVDMDEITQDAADGILSTTVRVLTSGYTIKPTTSKG